MADTAEPLIEHSPCKMYTAHKHVHITSTVLTQFRIFVKDYQTQNPNSCRRRISLLSHEHAGLNHTLQQIQG